MSDRRPLAKPADVSEYLGVPESTLKQWRWLGRGPKWTKVEHAVRYDWRDVEAYVGAQSSGGPAAA